MSTKMHQEKRKIKLVGLLHIALCRIGNFPAIRDEIKFINLKD